MVKSIIYIICCLPMLFCKQSFAQTIGKPTIGPAVYGKWHSPQPPVISNDGRYVCVSVDGNWNGKKTIKSLYGQWKKEVNSLKGFAFSSDSRQAAFIQGKDSLCVVKLGTADITYIADVASFKLLQQGQWLVYQLKTAGLAARDLATGKTMAFPVTGVLDYNYTENGNSLLVQLRLGKDLVVLEKISLSDGQTSTLWEGKQISQLTNSANQTQVTFIGSNGMGEQSIWRYAPGQEKAEELISDSEATKDYGLTIGSIQSFNSDGSKLLFSLKSVKTLPKPNTDAASVDVYSYLDPKIQSQQLKELANPAISNFSFVMQLSSHRIIQLTKTGELIVGSDFNSMAGNFALVQAYGPGHFTSENFWNKTSYSSLYLVSTNDGSRKTIYKNQYIRFLYTYYLSPDDKSIIYYDPEKRNYFSYDTHTGNTRNITQGIPTIWTKSSRSDWTYSAYNAAGLAAWINNDKSVLLYDQSDIWKIDIEGKRPGVNLTGGYGKKHHLLFRLSSGSIYQPQIINADERLLVNAFDRDTKANGFCTITASKPELFKPPLLLPYLFQASEDNEESPDGSAPIKARDAEVYLVQRQSATEAPNWFSTKDFKYFTALTDVHPESNYNWMSSELITWKLPNGKTNQGVLYKPEDFDPQKKYPVIFYYYEKLSARLHGFLYPHYTTCQTDIPTYVSNGYLVFTPDMHYEIGHPGKSVVNTVVSSAKYLSGFPYIDGKHIGLQGHSRGGWETNYIVTHTQVFAAAMSACGLTDYVSLYGGVRALGNGGTRSSAFETSSQRIGATLWDRPDLFIENSPVFKADQVTTPILMMANKLDGDIPFEQGSEFFTALRRLGKKAWMLQYDEEDHAVVYNLKDQKDLTIRMQQFFDHYLKDAPAPKWMVEGISASMKQVDQGYDLEPAGVEPGTGLLMSPSEQKEATSLLLKPKPLTKK